MLYQVLFQLSVLAMLGLAYIFPLLRPSSEALSNWSNRNLKLPLAFSRLVMDGFWLSVAASLAVWPVTAWHFGSVAIAGGTILHGARNSSPASGYLWLKFSASR